MPLRILHIVENLHLGAVENWLLRMLGHARARDVHVDWTFYCQLNKPGAMDERARCFGASIIYSPVPIGSKLKFARSLRSELRRGGYDVVHCHHDLISAVYLAASAGLKIRRRVVHIHNADESVLTPNVLKAAILRPALRQVCLALADRIIGISNHTLDSFLSGRRRRPGRDVVHYYGIDPAPFETTIGDRKDFLRSLNLPPDALVMLFGGRLVPEKNPVFTLEVLVALRQLEPRAVAVFAGAGSEEQTLRVRARELGIENFIRILGWRTDLPQIMICSDWFILPHLEHPMEGFGVAVVEAQLAGVPMLLSRGIADDPLLPTAVFRRLPLASDPKEWARAAVDLLQGQKPSRTATLAAFRESPMEMDRALTELLGLYA